MFLYLGGVIGLLSGHRGPLARRRSRPFLALVGIVNLPIVHFSVTWWNTLHQGSTVRLFGPSLIDARMLWPLLTMALAAGFWFAGSLLSRARVDLLELEGGKDWSAPGGRLRRGRTHPARSIRMSDFFAMGGYGALRVDDRMPCSSSSSPPRPMLPPLKRRRITGRTARQVEARPAARRKRP